MNYTLTEMIACPPDSSSRRSELNCTWKWKIGALPPAGCLSAFIAKYGRKDRGAVRGWREFLSCCKLKVYLPFPGSSMVEHSAVNRRVASSNLARGANFSFFLN